MDSRLVFSFALCALLGTVHATNSTGGFKNGATFVHLFEWSWNDVAVECEEWLGPYGFDAVQISPPMEHISGPQWWTRYQPVSYDIFSRSGDRVQFASMVKRCKAAGVNIYADAVINHMAAGSGTGINGSQFGGRSFPGLYSQDDFHHNDNDNKQNCAVTNYNDQHNVQTCDLVGLPDLCTGCPHVQSTLGAYLQDLCSLGVEGFRVDAAKHQEADQLKGVLAKGPGLYTFHEVISGSNEAVKPEMYFGIGQVTEFNFARQLAPNVLTDGKMQYLSSFGEKWGLMGSDHAVTFMDNHDTQRGEAQLTYKNGDLYTLANVFMLATPYGHPKVMSSYAFNDHDQGPPSSAVHQASSLNCGKGEWVCEHRQPQIAGMVKFRSIAAGEGVTDFISGQNGDAIAFGRGSKAFVVINRSSSTWTATFKTGLPAKEYTDALKTLGKVTVKDGSVQMSVPAMKSVALY